VDHAVESDHENSPLIDEGAHHVAIAKIGECDDRGEGHLADGTPQLVRRAAKARAARGILAPVLATGWPAITVLVITLVAPSAGAQTSSCLETGLGVYPGWRGLSYGERARRCLEIEQRSQERLDRQQERDALRELRREQRIQADPELQRLRQQECLVNAAACAIPGTPSVSPPRPPAAPPPAPPPPPAR